MKKIKDVLNKFEENLKSIDQLGEIGSDVGGILLEILTDLKYKNKDSEGFKPYKDNLDKAIEMVKNIKDHDILKEKYQIIYNQSVILVVAAFESFMNELVRDLIDFYPEIIEWPEKKQVSFDPNILKYSSPSLGSLIVKSLLVKKYNFQDLKSVLDFLKDYLKIDVKLDDNLKDKLIKYAALRHVIIHNSAKIDEKFIKQIREISYKDDYKIDDDVKLSGKDYKEVRSCFLQLAKKIVSEIEKLKINLFSQKKVL